jgi:multimeric flavodoxin WrbA
MNGKVHVWLVEDALRYVKARGNSRQKAAFQAWESAYGGGDLNSIGTYDTKIVDVIGRESLYTDKYHDLAIYLESFAGLWQDNITEYDGYIFSPLNHFMTVPWQATRWMRTNGYYYPWSPQVGNDRKAMTGKVDTKDAEVDNDHSPIVDRCRFGWTGSNNLWSENWEVDIRGTCFVPVNVLAWYYYYRMLFRWFNYVDVNGERFDKINGMFLLGPVCHAVADACVPQHAIGTLDLKHQEWESMVEGWAYSYSLEDFDQVEDLLSNHMTRHWYTGGALKDMLAVDYITAQLCGWKTYVKFLQQNNIELDQMMSSSFWNGYIANPALVKSHAAYNYNLAIAATVLVITEGCYDVISTGGGSNPTPKIRGVKSLSHIGGLPQRPPKDRSTSWRHDLTLRSELNYLRPDTMLGYQPQSWRPLASAMNATRMHLLEWNIGRAQGDEVVRSLKGLEQEFGLEFRRERARGRNRFDQARNLELPEQVSRLREACGLPSVSRDLETNAMFGLGTIRVPSTAELNDPRRFRDYLEQTEASTLNGMLVSTTRCIALQKQFMSEAQNRRHARIMAMSIRKLEALRAQMIKDKTIPQIGATVPRSDLTAINIANPPQATDVAR